VAAFNLDFLCIHPFRDGNGRVSRLALLLQCYQAGYEVGHCAPRDMDRLQAKIPPELRYSLHVNMISLGREICTPSVPHCDECPISALCPKIGVHRMKRIRV
jgi:endonuclease III